MRYFKLEVGSLYSWPEFIHQGSDTVITEAGWGIYLGSHMYLPDYYIKGEKNQGETGVHRFLVSGPRIIEATKHELPGIRLESSIKRAKG